ECLEWPVSPFPVSSSALARVFAMRAAPYCRLRCRLAPGPAGSLGRPSPGGFVMRRRPALASAASALACLALVVFLPLLAACGGGGSSSKGPTKTATGGKIQVTASDIHFDVKTIKATPGALTVTLVENGALEHTFKINGTNLLLKVNSGK